MPYKNVKRNFKKVSRKVYKKPVRKPKSSLSGIVKLVKKITLKQCETKSTTYNAENINLYHNTPYILSTNMLATTQGITDSDRGSGNPISNRLGDEIVARGISVKIWVANKADRPNVMYRVFVFRYRSNDTVNDTLLFTGDIGNRMLTTIDTEKIKILKHYQFNLNSGQNAITGTTDKEAHKMIKFYVPLKNYKIKYSDAAQIPKFSDIGMCIVVYDSYGTLTTDNIASCAVVRKFYFKDP